MKIAVKIVVGLGNPGAKYVGTRHNVGFEVIDYLSAAPGFGQGQSRSDKTAGSFRVAFQSLVAERNEAGEKVLLVKPETFMNLSGRAVRAVLDFYKATPAELLVICDDYNLPLGRIRVRAGGSHGGQNGLRNVQEQLGTDQYARLRIGVGQPGPGEAVDFVLSRFKPGERPAIDTAIAHAATGVGIWLRQGLEVCMNRMNGTEPTEKKKPRLNPPRPAVGKDVQPKPILQPNAKPEDEAPPV